MNNEDSLVNDEGVPGHERSQRIAYLVAGYLEENLSLSEKTELDNWLKESESNQRIFTDLTDVKKLERQFRFTDQLTTTAAWDRISEGVNEKQIRRIATWRYVAAATLVFLLGFVVIKLLNLSSLKNEKPVAFVPAPGKINPGDIGPGSNQAILQLGNGSIITLTDSVIQPIAAGVSNVEGQLIYEHPAKGSAGEWHTLNTPPGGGYMITLPDESKVWLNAASSLRYPPVFTGKQRRVELSGEAYFEVKHNGKMPFVVELPNNTEVTVLGTSFNINAYHDEPVLKTTLIEGKVRVASSITNAELTIEPGEQAAITRNGKMNRVFLPNAADELAWQKGYFEFHDQTIESIMRTVARWYDADIVYEFKPRYHFNASIRRNVPVSRLLEMLQKTKRVHFEVVDRKIIVKS
ncbi:FecR family protein [Flavitalea sp.]|nr:FecR domain-containing protein [Flavitalea sp.]